MEPRRRRRNAHQLPAVVALVALVFAACGSDSVPSPSTALGTVPPGPVASEPSVAAATSTPADSPSSTPTPTATPSPTPSPSPSPSPTPTSTPTAALQAAEAPTCSGTESAGHGALATGSSRNWAGYIVRQAGTRVVCVQASWTEPKLTCPAKGERDVAIWVGIDGTATTTKARPLIQVGTWGSCRNGVERHYGWHEVYPTQASIPFGPTLHAGDRMAASVVFRKRSFTLTLVDLTTGRRMELVEHAPKAARLTAEWIVEAPSGGCPSSCHQLALPKFTPVRFSDARATIGSHVAGVDGPWMRERTTMRSARGILVSAGPLFSSGEGFTVSHP